MRKVVYNGKTECPTGCSSPSELKYDAVYTVRYSMQSDTVTFFALDEVSGYFYDKWFDDLSQLETRFVTSKRIPEEEKVLECSSLTFEKGHIKHSPGSIVFKVHTFDMLGKNTYRVIAKGIVFIVAVQS